VLQVSSDGKEREQDSEDNPNVNAHLSSPAAALPAQRCHPLLRVQHRGRPKK